MQAAASEPAAAPVLPKARRRLVDARARSMMAVAAFLVGVFIVLALMLRHAGGTGIDLAITQAVQRVNGPVISAIMLAISAPGYWPWPVVVIGVASLLLAFNRRYPEAAFVLLTEGAGALTAQIKPLVERPRPAGDSIRIVAAALDFSYPSGHVVGYVALYGFLFFLVYVLYRRSLVRRILLVLLGSLVGLIGLSRIHLGHHWASDVLGGYALGTAYLLLLIVLYRLLVARPAAEHETEANVPTNRGTQRAFEARQTARRIHPGEGVN